MWILFNTPISNNYMKKLLDKIGILSLGYLSKWKIILEKSRNNSDLHTNNNVDITGNDNLLDMNNSYVHSSMLNMWKTESDKKSKMGDKLTLWDNYLIFHVLQIFQKMKTSWK